MVQLMQQPIQSNECAHSIVVLVYIGVTTMKKRVYTLYRVSTIGQVEKDDIPAAERRAKTLIVTVPMLCFVGRCSVHTAEIA